ncbi:MAG: efflux RND transporter permease subunit, partial [Proteobacteria bacterium]|nr:efflux RND transporter permease subunit [Pseudomonadota bacterium]
MESKGGIISLFVRHPTAANLLMVIMIVAGLFALRQTNTQFFPDFGIDVVSVQVEWPGASAEDIDDNIVQAIEPELRFLDGVKKVRSTSVEGVANLSVEFLPSTDIQAALADVETAVGQVKTLPEDSEKPEIRRIVRYDSINRIVISGPYPESSLKAIAKRIRDELLDRGIDKVDLSGARDEEIWVEVPPTRLLQLNLKLADIAEKIRSTSQDLPSGDLSGSVKKSIRSIGIEKNAPGIGRIEIRSLKNGEKIFLKDVAKVRERFNDDQPTLERNGHRAIELHVQRALSADALQVADKVEAYIKELLPALPPNLTLETFNVQSDLIRGRIALLLENGLSGLVLVVLILFLFLSVPVAFWVAIGIPVAIMATIAVMLATGQSINMVSLFGMIMALGIVVDDAIVVGEHADKQFRSGLGPMEAAETGAQRMAAPVVSSSLTTIAAFTPLFIISDVIGDIIRGIPLVVVAMILASLVECFLALPGHLRGAFTMVGAETGALRTRFNNRFDRFRDTIFERLVRRAVTWRYTTIAIAVGAFIVSIGVIQSGRINFTFFPAPEADRIFAAVQMNAGTPRAETIRMVHEMERALKQAEASVTGGKGGLVKFNLLKFGTSVARGDVPASQSDNVGGLVVELVDSDKRQIRTNAFIEAWRARIKAIPGTDIFTLTPAQGGPPGRDVDIRLKGRDLADLKQAALDVRGLLGRYPGVSDANDNLQHGKQEAIMTLTPLGRALGFTTESVGRQVRNAFEGAIAKRFPREDEEVTVRVRYDRDDIAVRSLDGFRLRAPGGGEVPLSEVVNIREKQGFSRITREDGKREVAITAETDKALTNNNKVLVALRQDGLADIAEDYGLKADFAGRAKEQKTTLDDMKTGSMMGLSAIYIILAWVFASYVRPLVVMSIIPLGFVFAVIGHLLLGYDLTVLSLIAMVGLSGIVVNDSIILVRTIDERIAAGEPVFEAIIDGTKDRLRAVILTSATTIGGLTPLLFETSLQARFLIPMAVTIIFGLMVTTF